MKKKLLNRLSHKRDGIDMMIYGIGFIWLMIIVMMYLVSIKFIEVSKENVDDAIISSALSAAVIKDEPFYSEGDLILDKTQTLTLFNSCLKGNLGIDLIQTDEISIEDVVFNEGTLGDRIRIVEFTIYNVTSGHPKQTLVPSDGDLKEVCIPEEGAKITKHTYRNGVWLADQIVYSKNQYEENVQVSYDTGYGTLYETSIYCKIEIPIHTYFGVENIATKEKLVSVKNN